MRSFLLCVMIVLSAWTVSAGPLDPKYISATLPPWKGGDNDPDPSCTAARFTLSGTSVTVGVDQPLSCKNNTNGYAPGSVIPMDYWWVTGPTCGGSSGKLCSGSLTLTEGTGTVCGNGDKQLAYKITKTTACYGGTTWNITFKAGGITGNYWNW